MNLFIDNKSGIPIYKQVYDQIRSEIVNGDLKPDDSLPSIRNLAKDLRISVITTKRAYEELEKEGFIYTVAGKGCFVAEMNMDWIRENTLREIEGHMMDIMFLSSRIQCTKDEILEMWNTIWEDES
jgi:GntR family transcriptional regulator